METDQRGTARPLDGDGDGTPVCDAGALEAAAVDPVPTTTTTSTTATTVEGSSPSTTSTLAGAIGPCVLAQLPDDSLAGVACAVSVVRGTLGGPPAASCTCKRCSLDARLGKVASLLEQAETATSTKKCKRKLKKTRRAAQALSAKADSLVGRGCIAPADRAASLDAETEELARRAAALAKSAFCDTSAP